MKTILKYISTLSLLALSLFAWGCSDLAEPAPSLDPAPMVVMSTTGESYVVAQEVDPLSGSISAEIGSAGGELTLGAHTLYVSEGAVAEPTIFTMTRDPESPIRVKLSAGVDGGNEIGTTGFAAPVTLQLNFGTAWELPADLSGITLIYFRADGLVETLPTSVDAEKTTISAELPHFSIYGAGWP